MKFLRLLIPVFCLMILTNHRGSAQVSDSTASSELLIRPTFLFGIHLGPAFSGFTHNEEIFTQKRTGASIGIFAEFIPIPFLGISLETNYLMSGASSVSPYLIYPESVISPSGGSITKISSDITFHSIQVPVLINIRPKVEGNVTPKLSVGYMFEYLFYATSKDQLLIAGSSKIPLSYQSVEDVTSSFQKWNHGPVFGTGIDFKGTRLKYSLEVRYQLGLRDINGLAGLNVFNHQPDFSMNTFTVLFTIAL